MADRPADPATTPGDSMARLRTDLTRLAAQVADLQVGVAAAGELAGAIDELGTRVERLADQLDPPGSPVAPEPVAWVDLPADRAAAALVELSGWMSTALAYHRVTSFLYPCWYRHPGLVQVLLDARLAWLAAYREPGPGRVLAALDWSQRHLPHLEQRVRELLGRCSGVRHEPVAAASPAVTEEDLRRYARWWALDRDPATEPGLTATDRRRPGFT